VREGSITTDLGKTYARQGSDDARFNDYYGTMQSIVTSSAQADSGLFETNLRDERYLPFEGAGIAGSQWQFTLPSEVKQFDFDTITDVVVHVRYTAREGGELLKAAAVQNLQTQIKKAQTIGSVCLFSIRHEFPSAWAKFQSVTIGGSTLTAELSLTLVPELYPFWAQKPGVKALELFAESSSTTPINVTGAGNPVTLVSNPLMGNLLSGNLVSLPLAVTDPAHPFDLFFDNNSMVDLWIAITWGKT
jgi:Tc toxin complex TcA C-terminal TcB-binding domain